MLNLVIFFFNRIALNSHGKYEKQAGGRFHPAESSASLFELQAMVGESYFSPQSRIDVPLRSFLIDIIYLILLFVFYKIDDTRAGTPDSASSLGSSSFSQKPQHLQSMPQQPPTGSQSPFQQMQLNPQAQQALQQQQQQQQQQQPPSSQLPQTNATMGHQQNSQVPNMPHADHQFQRMQSPHHQHQLQYQQNQTQMGFQQPGYPSNQTIRPAVSAPGYPNVPTDQNQQQQMTGSPAHVPPGYPQQHQSSQQQYNYPAASTGQPSHQLEHNKAQGPSNQMPQGPPNQMPAGPTFPTPYNAGGGPPHQPAGNPYSRGPQPGGYVRPTASYPPGYQ
ncbi:hypothetical protein GQR58_015397 [Nymphon striatum]|nr:hypothetical protein GQR58_015397 [Nymphon striatum]